MPWRPMRSWTNAYKVGAAALTLALLAVVAGCPFLASVPLAIFVALCLMAPFFHRWSFYLPIISRGNPRKKWVALTFDDGPDPLTTPKLLELLKAHGMVATFFVTGKNALAYPDLIRAILPNGHTVGNHSFSHNPLLVFKGQKAIFRDIDRTQRVLARLGVEPLVYRPPVGITYPVLRRILSRLNLVAVNFSCSARDRGNRRIHGIAERVLKKVRAGDIILLHDLRPIKQGCVADWLAEVDRLLRGVKAAGLEMVPLERLIDRPVDRRVVPAAHCASKAGLRQDNHR